MNNGKNTILIIENGEEEIKKYLSIDGFFVDYTKDVEEGFRFIKSEKPDLVLLNLKMPGFYNLDVCKKLKADHLINNIPVIIISDRKEATDIVAALEVGADDYIVKPFSYKVLFARIRNCLRKRQISLADNSDVIKLNNLEIHPGYYEVLVQGHPIDLTQSEYRLIYLLASRPRWVFSRSQIVDAIRGEGYTVSSRIIDVLIVALRKKLGKYGKYIESVRGVGYRINENL